MKLIDALPASRFWIYKLNSMPTQRRRGIGLTQRMSKAIR